MKLFKLFSAENNMPATEGGLHVVTTHASMISDEGMLFLKKLQERYEAAKLEWREIVQEGV